MGFFILSGLPSCRVMLFIFIDLQVLYVAYFPLLSKFRITEKIKPIQSDQGSLLCSIPPQNP